MSKSRLYELSVAFARGIEMSLTEEEFHAVIQSNRVDKECCHSHDYIDANMVMLSAFRQIMDREPDLSEESDEILWNAAWSLAKSKDFYVNGWMTRNS